MSAPKKLLVANRSEIAVRIFRSAAELGFRTVAIYAQEDRFGVHRFKSDEAYLIGTGKGPVAAYLDIPGIIDIAKEHGIDYIHPGYGFLSENAAFARACSEAGITFIGPRVEHLEMMGDKTAARLVAEKVGVPTVPGTPDPVTDPETAVSLARQIGFPLIIKAAFGGGGRGMRVVRTEAELLPLLQEAQTEAGVAFGNPAVFLERFIGRAKHIEVQILGDKHGNIVHLHERDCSVQRRHQKVVEVAPSINLDPRVVQELCDAATKLCREIGYENAGTMEFLVDMDTQEWFFIEMNPRIQVEHTVTEMITGIDIVRSQILIAQGETLHGAAIAIPDQEKIPRNGFAVQCRITTEDPEANFTPDYGKIVAYRSPAGLGIRLDGAMGDAGAVISPFYDSMLVKVTAFAPTFSLALQRTKRALGEFSIRGVKTNIPFLDNVISHEDFVSGKATTRFIDNSPELFQFQLRQLRATRLLSYLGDVIVNGNEQVKGRPRPDMSLPRILPYYDPKQPLPKGTRDKLKELGPQQFAQWTREQRKLLLTDTTFRDAHQSLLAARMRSFDMLAVADFVAQRCAGLFSLEMWGGATFDTSMRFLCESPYQRLRDLRQRIPNILFQMLLRGANGVGYSNYPDNVIRGFIRHAAESGMDVFRVFDSLNYLPNLTVAMEAVQESGAICEAALCYTGDILDSRRDKYSLQYYTGLAKELQKMGAHFLAIKDMAGLCKPYAVEKLVRAIKEETGLPVHFHTHDASGISSASVIKAAEAGVDVADAAIASLSGLSSQPGLNSLIAALAHTDRATGLDQEAFDQLTLYWEAVRQYYAPFDTAPKFGSAEVYQHEMPGGQYTNLREQATAMGLGTRWPEVVRYYREVNQLFGDIVKVTPSSKVVGDMAIFLLTRGIEPSEVAKLAPGSVPFPASVIDMLSGGLGQPLGGFPKEIQKVVLGDKEPRTGRPGDHAAPIDLDEARKSLSLQLGREISDDELWMHLMYPDVFKTFAEKRARYSDLGVLPTPAFFFGLQLGEEIAFDLEKGKQLIVRLIHVAEKADEEGFRHVTFELNGRARETRIKDLSAQATKKARVQADPADPKQIGAPIPGVISAVFVTTGDKVKKGDKLCAIEAMKMQTTIYAPYNATVQKTEVALGDAVQSKDLLLTFA